MTVKHATAGAFVFSHTGQDWRLGLILHGRLDRWMIPGGHVEDDETQAEAAVREVREEAGLEVRLLAPAGVGLPRAYPHPPVPAPWWITEIPVGADNHLDVPHVHVDHQYVVVADDPSPVIEPELPFEWFSCSDLATLAMFEDTRVLGQALFTALPAREESISLEAWSGALVSLGG